MTEAPKLRMRTYDLEWPLEVDGQTISQITLRRLTGGDVASLQEAMLGKEATDEAMIAAFADQPAGVIARLDADDFMEMKERMVDFLPKRLRAALEQAVTDQVAEPEPDQAG